QHELPAYYGRIRTKSLPPESLADHHDMVCARTVLLGKKHSSALRFRAHQLEEVAGHQGRADALRLSRRGQVKRSPSQKRNPFEARIAISPLDKLRGGCGKIVRTKLQLWIGLPDHYETIWRPIGQRP